MSSIDMTMLVARKEMKNIFRNKGLLIGGLWFGGMFAVLLVFLGGQEFSLSNAIFSVSLLAGTLVG